MKIAPIMLALGLVLAPAAFAQAPAAAATVHAVCKDGSPFEGASLRGVVVRAVDAIGRRIAVEPGAIAFKDLVTAADKLGSHERLLAGEPTEIHGELSSAGAPEDIRAALAGAMAGNPFGRRESRPEIPPAEAVEAVPVGVQAADPVPVEALESRAHVEATGEV